MPSPICWTRNDPKVTFEGKGQIYIEHGFFFRLRSGGPAVIHPPPTTRLFQTEGNWLAQQIEPEKQKKQHTNVSYIGREVEKDPQQAPDLRYTVRWSLTNLQFPPAQHVEPDAPDTSRPEKNSKNEKQHACKRAISKAPWGRTLLTR